jgi:hypothetical protein
MTKYCIKCGTELNDNDKFCNKCGAAVEVVNETQNTNAQQDDKSITSLIASIIYTFVIPLIIAAVVKFMDVDTTIGIILLVIMIGSFGYGLFSLFHNGFVKKNVLAKNLATDIVLTIVWIIVTFVLFIYFSLQLQSGILGGIAVLIVSSVGGATVRNIIKKKRDKK